MLVDGVEVEYKRPDGTIAGDRVRLIDSIIRTTTTAWPSTSSPSSRQAQPPAGIVLFINGLPLAVIELKNAGRRERHDLERIQPAQTYKRKSRRCSPSTRCSSFPTASRPGSAR